MPTLVLLRHGQSQWNLENRFTGWWDVDLSDQGISEARSAGALLRDKGLDYAVAAHRLAFLMREARRLKLSGVGLKEEANLLDRSKMKSVSR